MPPAIWSRRHCSRILRLKMEQKLVYLPLAKDRLATLDWGRDPKLCLCSSLEDDSVSCRRRSFCRSPWPDDNKQNFQKIAKKLPADVICSLLCIKCKKQTATHRGATCGRQTPTEHKPTNNWKTIYCLFTGRELLNAWKKTPSLSFHLRTSSSFETLLDQIGVSAFLHVWCKLTFLNLVCFVVDCVEIVTTVTILGLSGSC